MKSCPMSVVAFLVLVGVLSTLPVAAADWGYSLGLHDFVVPEMSSHTFGVNGSIWVTHRTKSDILLFGNYDVFIDRDKDELDPDHIPVWWRTEFGARNQVWKISSTTHLDWVVDLNTKRNTVSSIEWTTKVFPGIVLAYDGEKFLGSAKAGVGYFGLEIDDDVPKERGYTRDDFTNNTAAYTLAADGSGALGDRFRLGGAVQFWADQDGWLEYHFRVQLSFDSGGWIKDSELVVRGEYTRYNLEPYVPTGEINPITGSYLPILPWDDDILVRTYMRIPF